MRGAWLHGARLLLLGAAFGLAACGKKGPLYLPTPTPAPAGAATAGAHSGPVAPTASAPQPIHHR